MHQSAAVAGFLSCPSTIRKAHQLACIYHAHGLVEIQQTVSMDIPGFPSRRKTVTNMNADQYLKAFFSELNQLLPVPGWSGSYDHSLGMGKDGRIEIRLSAGDWYKVAITELDQDPIKAAHLAAQARTRWPDEHLLRVLDLAQHLLGKQLSFEWRETPLGELGGQTPLDVARSVSGARQVASILIATSIVDSDTRQQLERETAAYFSGLTLEAPDRP
jgi:hypothetical protein